MPAEERERLRRAHDLLVAAGPLPELPPELEHPVRPHQSELIPFFPKRRYAAAAALAAALAALAFGGGYLFGHSTQSGFAAAFNVRMHGTSAAPDALASIQIAGKDGDGNWPMLVKVSGLPELPKGGYYELWLTRNGNLAAACGTFRAHGDKTAVRLSVPYHLKSFDGWVVTEQLPGRHGAHRVMLTTGTV